MGQTCYKVEFNTEIIDNTFCQEQYKYPGRDYMKCYCYSGNYRDCPYLGGEDPYELHPETKKRNEVIEMIEKLPKQIVVEDKWAIENARIEYDALSDRQKHWVKNYDKLSNAEWGLLEAQRKEFDREEEARKAKEEALRIQEAKKKSQKDTSSANRSVTQEKASATRISEQKKKDTVPTPSTDLSLFDKMLVGLEGITDPHMYRTPWWVRAYRIVLTVLSWLLVIRYAPEKPPVEIILFVAFASLQLVSFAVSFFACDAMKFRLSLWGAELVLLIITGCMIWFNPVQEIIVELAVVVLLYPVAALAYILIRWFLNMIL